MDAETKTLTRAWLLVAGLTILSVGTVLEEPGRWSGFLAMALALVKARQVLDHFLGLRRAGGAWRNAFTTALAIIVGGMMLIGLAAGGLS